MPEEDFELFLSLLSQLLRLDSRQKSAIADELRDHLEERLGDLEEQGVPRKEAVRKALEEFGDAAGLASQFTSLSHHRRRRILMRSALATAVLAAVVFLGIFLFGPAGPQGPPQQAAAQAPKQPPPEQASREKSPELRSIMPEALLKEIDVEFIDTPLLDAVDYLSDATKMPAFIDEKALAAREIALKVPITFLASKTPVNLILNRMLKPLKLAWYSKNGMLFITTRIAEEDILFTKYYPVKPILDLGFSQQQLVNLVQNMTSGPWVDVDGTGGVMLFIGQMLAVRQTFHDQLEVEELLAGLMKSTQPIVRLEPKENVKLRKALSSPVQVEFIDTPLKDAAEFLSEFAKVPVVMDKVTLEDEGIGLDAPVNLTLKGKTLQTTLALMLRPLSAEPVLEDGTILITTTIEAEEHLTTVIYNVKDIADSASAMNQLQEAILTVTRGPWVNVDGVGGMISWVPSGTLVVRQTEPVHQEIQKLLENLRKSGGAVKLQPQPSQVYTGMYRMNADMAEDLLTALPELIAPGTWQTDKANGPGTIRKVAAGQSSVKPPAEKNQPEKKAAEQPAAKPPAKKAEPEPQYIVVPQAVLVIRQTREAHREIEQFLMALLPPEERTFPTGRARFSFP